MKMQRLMVFLLLLGLVVPIVWAADTTNDEVTQDLEESISPIKSVIRNVFSVIYGVTETIFGLDDSILAETASMVAGKKAYCWCMKDDTSAIEGSIFDASTRKYEKTYVALCGSLKCPSKTTKMLLLDTDGRLQQYKGIQYLKGLEGTQEKFEQTKNFYENYKGMILLLGFLLPLIMLAFILMDFFTVTAMFSWQTSAILAWGLAIIGAISGAYTKIIQQIFKFFGAGGIFFSLFTLYLFMGLAFWLIGGYKRAKAMTEKSGEIVDNMLQVYKGDLMKALMLQRAASEKK